MTKKSSKKASEHQSPQELPEALVPQVVEFEELSHDEERDLLYLERKIERSFVEAGQALLEIRQRRLFRSIHLTFEDYIRVRFGMQRAHSYRLMDASVVVQHLEANCLPMGDKNPEMSPIGRQILPTSERQVRPLTKLDPNQQIEAWSQAVEKAGNKVPSGRIVKDIVQQIRERHPVPNPWHIGDVASIIVKENPDLRGCGGCWAIITAVRDFSCTVKLWNGIEYQVRPENLKELLYSKAQQDEVKLLCDRLSSIRVDEVEKPVREFLGELGKLDRPWLTELEEVLLTNLEKMSHKKSK